jgi:hypothetical protein
LEAHCFHVESIVTDAVDYEIYDWELLVIMITLEDFCRYFKVWMDHANLQYFKKPQKLNRQQAHWLMELQDYHFTLYHITGKSNL